MKILLKRLTPFLLLLLLIFSCKMANKITYINLSPLYEADKKPEITGMRVLHENDSISTTFVKYKLANLLYQPNKSLTTRRAFYSNAFALYPSYESNQVLDSATFYMSDSLNYGKNTEQVFSFPVKAKFPGNYLLEIQLTDLNAGTTTLLPHNILKETKNVAQAFLPSDNNKTIIFEDWIDSQTNFRLLTKNDSIKEIAVRYYHRDFPIALPPFSSANQETYTYEADEIYTFKTENHESELMVFPNEGFYHFQPDSSSRGGLTMFRFYDGYPKVIEAAQLIPPLRYLTSNKEFKQLLGAHDQKMAADSFWISFSGNEERALEILKQYYTRVELANRFFTSFKEGWKTDRGMIYIIFGQPKTVFRRDNIETWVYGEKGNRVSLTFDFIKAINPFTENDFVLQRQADFKTPWFVAVDYWRR